MQSRPDDTKPEPREEVKRGPGKPPQDTGKLAPDPHRNATENLSRFIRVHEFSLHGGQLHTGNLGFNARHTCSSRLKCVPAFPAGFSQKIIMVIIERSIKTVAAGNRTTLLVDPATNDSALSQLTY